MPPGPDRADAVMQQLHEAHAEALWHFCLRLTSYDHVRAEDVVQDTLLRAWRTGPSMDASAGSLRSWLFTVARNIVIDDWRSKKNRSETPVAELPEVGEDDHVDQMLTSWLVADALTQLSEEHRAVLRECYFRGASVAEASIRLGVRPGTVKSRTHYALRALRLALEERGVTA